MTDFDTNFADGAAGLLGHQGRAVIYLDPELDPLPLTAIVGPAVSEEVRDDNGRRLRTVRTITMPTTVRVAAAFVEHPRTDAKIDVDGEEWAIESIELETVGLAKCVCVRGGVIERSRQTLRNRA